jgi:hypothetical protein
VPPASDRSKRWTLSRAGIINVYQYGDETLEFGRSRYADVRGIARPDGAILAMHGWRLSLAYELGIVLTCGLQGLRRGYPRENERQSDADE